MKAKIGGIPFDETTKVELKKINKPAHVLPPMKALMYNATGKIELRTILIPTIVIPSNAGQLANTIFHMTRRH